MSHENKNIYTSTDGTKTGVHKQNPTAPFHVGTDTQVDGDTVVTGDATVGNNLDVNNNATIGGNATITGDTTTTGKTIAEQGVEHGDFTGTPNPGHVRWHSGDLEVWNGTEWKSLTLSGIQLHIQMSSLNVPISSAAFNMEATTPPAATSLMSLLDVSLGTALFSFESTNLQEFTSEANA